MEKITFSLKVATRKLSQDLEWVEPIRCDFICMRLCFPPGFYFFNETLCPSTAVDCCTYLIKVGVQTNYCHTFKLHVARLNILLEATAFTKSSAKVRLLALFLFVIKVCSAGRLEASC